MSNKEVSVNMPKVVAFLLMVALCHPVISTNPEEGSDARLRAVLAELKQKETTIKEQRHLYDLSYALYISDVKFLDEFGGEHAPHPNTYNAKQLPFILIGLAKIVSRILINILKYSDLYFPEEPLFAPTRKTLLQRLHEIRTRMHDAKMDIHADGGHLIVEDFSIDDDGMGYISDANDPYEPAMALIERGRQYLKGKAEGLLTRFPGGLRPFALCKVFWRYNAPRDLALEIMAPSTNLDQILGDLKSLMPAVPDHDRSLQYDLLKLHRDKLRYSGIKYEWLRSQAEEHHYATGHMQGDLEDFLADLECPPPLYAMNEAGRTLYDGVRNGALEAYVEISDELVNEHTLHPMHDLSPYISRTSSSDAGRNDMDNSLAALRDRFGMLQISRDGERRVDLESDGSTSASDLVELRASSPENSGGRCGGSSSRKCIGY
ncbi:hypothetical protein SeLEV6574_g05740 [Synchytrium endobioticum]|uniref:Uncharacterized protein n=1 Tax=Synchytrium endobioticum TaxID=286115 RepID=A0A507CSJ4_9FUNG|nr:hypothetical protein SeLEV6574_g05740 [Synchytrium endobioticum]